MEKKETKKCPECGKKINENDKFCGSCGYELNKTENNVQKAYRFVVKKLKNGDYIMYALLIIGFIVLIAGVTYDIPTREFSFYSIKEYVGGDAYNAMIEASLRSGEITAGYICKTLYTCTGIVLMALGINRISNK